GLERAVSSSGLDPRHVCVELTESSLLEIGPATRAALDRLTGEGFGLGIDDFGTGSASLAAARSVPADTIKIDRSFVAGLTTSAGDRAVVAAVVELARTLGVATVAEGIETVEQLEVLRLMGCRLGRATCSPARWRPASSPGCWVGACCRWPGWPGPPGGR